MPRKWFITLPFVVQGVDPGMLGHRPALGPPVPAGGDEPALGVHHCCFDRDSVLGGSLLGFAAGLNEVQT